MSPRGICRWAPLLLAAATCGRPPADDLAPARPATASAPSPSAAPPVEALGTVDRVGGAWVRCLGGFRPGESPEADLARLAQGCALDVGLVPLGAPVEGLVDATGAPLRLPLPLAEGACGRILAVGDPGLEALELSVEGPGGALVASEGAADRWPVLFPDRPFCALRAGPSSLVVTARRGRGRFVLQTFGVPAPKP